MDNLVLIRVSAVLHDTLSRAVLRDLTADSAQRFRLVFDLADSTRSVVVSLRPEQPWIGRPTVRPSGVRPHGSSFSGRASRSLRGAVLDSVRQLANDRVVRLAFADGRSLLAELATHGANLLLLDETGRVMWCARRPRSGHDRLTPGSVYRPPPIPARLLVPFGAPAEAIDRHLAALERDGEPVFEGLRRHVFGIGSRGARLVLEQARLTGTSVGAVLAERLERLERGDDDPVIDGSTDPLEAAEQGELATSPPELLPWPPAGGKEGIDYMRRGDAAATAGLYYEALERAAQIESRAQGLVGLLRREIDRVAGAEAKAARDIEGFEKPDRHRRWGEALLAGMGTARRVGDAVWVPDPYDAGGAEIAVPVAASQRIEDAAAEQFHLHRRARRGLERSASRMRALAERRDRLERVADRFDAVRGLGAIEALEQAMQREGIPVGLQVTRRARERARLERPRLEGVRIYHATDGAVILVGRNARENHRLTFKLSAPDDFWFHVRGCRGAHVILRNPTRCAEPPEADLHEAAGLAAWYSEARGEDRVDVHWTRRRNVRKPRSASPGTVVVKRPRTVRVRPAAPIEESEERR